MSHSKKEIPSNFTALEITESHPWFSELGSKDTLVDRFSYINNVLLSKFQRPETFGMFFKENQTNRQNIQQQFKARQIQNENSNLNLAYFQDNPNLWWITSVDTQGKTTIIYNHSMFGITSKKDNCTVKDILTALFSSHPNFNEKLSGFKGIYRDSEIDEITDIALQQLIISFYDKPNFEKWQQKIRCLTYIDTFLRYEVNKKSLEINTLKKRILLYNFTQQTYDSFVKLLDEISNHNVNILTNDDEEKLIKLSDVNFPFGTLLLSTIFLGWFALNIFCFTISGDPFFIGFGVVSGLCSIMNIAILTSAMLDWGKSIYYSQAITEAVNKKDNLTTQKQKVKSASIDSLLNLLNDDGLDATHTNDQKSCWQKT